MKQTVIGIFDDAPDAAKAVTALTTAGFGPDSIDQSSRSSNENAGMASESGPAGNSVTDSDYYDTGKTNGIGSFFKSLFGGGDDADHNDTADRYSEIAGRSHSIITVHAEGEDRAQMAAEIMDDCGAIDIDNRVMKYASASAVSASNQGDTAATGAIPIIEEQLQVGKRVVETGGARLRSRIVNRPVEEQLRLREERVRVERTVVNRPATEADFQTFREGEIEVIEHAEVPVVSKEARVVGEVSLSTDVEERNETISDTVRRTEVDVEDIAGKETRRPIDGNDKKAGSL